MSCAINLSLEREITIERQRDYPKVCAHVGPRLSWEAETFSLPEKAALITPGIYIATAIIVSLGVRLLGTLLCSCNNTKAPEAVAVPLSLRLSRE